MTPPTPGATPPRTLAIIRIAILLGVLAFGAITWFLHRRPGWTPIPAQQADALRRTGMVVWAVGLAGISLLRLRWTRTEEPRARAQTGIVGWAMAEVPALWGGVYYMLTGSVAWYAAGLLFLLLVFRLFPIPRR